MEDLRSFVSLVVTSYRAPPLRQVSIATTKSIASLGFSLPAGKSAGLFVQLPTDVVAFVFAALGVIVIPEHIGEEKDHPLRGLLQHQSWVTSPLT